MPYAPEEAGFKDTVKANPGQITVVRAVFTLPSTALTPMAPSRMANSATSITATSSSMRITT